MKSMVRDLALTLAFALELVAVVAAGWCGVTLDAPPAVRVIAGILAPLAVIGLWGAVVSPRARFARPRWRRELTETLVWLAALGALPATGHPVLAGLFAVLVVADRVALRMTTGVHSRLEPTGQGTDSPVA